MAVSHDTSLSQLGRYRSARKKRPRPVTALQPRLTPMIDVTFQLLLFFLLTMRFQQAEGQLPADLPRLTDAAAVTTPLEPIWIHLRPSTDEGGVQIDIRQYHLTMTNWAQLHAELVELRDRLGSDEAPVVIDPGDGVSWADALNAFNEARRARFQDIAFAPKSGSMP